MLCCWLIYDVESASFQESGLALSKCVRPEIGPFRMPKEAFNRRVFPVRRVVRGRLTVTSRVQHRLTYWI